MTTQLKDEIRRPYSYFMDLIVKIFIEKKNSEGKPQCGKYIIGKENKINTAQNPRRATTAQEYPHQRGNCLIFKIKRGKTHSNGR